MFDITKETGVYIMLMNVFGGILIPFVGTTLGAACVFFMRKTLSKLLQVTAMCTCRVCSRSYVICRG